MQTDWDWKWMPDGVAKYHAYLRSPEWQALRYAVLQRSGGWCERCRGRRAVDVHHRTYARKYRERLRDLVHLCRDCHEIQHGLGGRWWGIYIWVVVLLILLVISLL